MHPVIAAHGEETLFLFSLFIWAAINATIGYLIGARRGNGASGAVMSVLFGPIGWLYAAVARGDLRKCPFCSEDVKPAAVVCRYCGRELPEIKQSVSEMPRQPPMEVAPPIEAPPFSKRAKIMTGCFFVAVFLILFVLSNRARRISSETALSPTASESETVQMESPSIVSVPTERPHRKSSLTTTPPPSAELNQMESQSSPTPAFTTTPSSDFIKLVKPVTIQTASGAITLEAGLSVPFVSRDDNNVRFHYGNAEYEIPVDATELAK